MLYKTHGTCATAIDVEVEGGIVRQVKFINGCPGTPAALNFWCRACPRRK